jgi:hypothetical protein
MPRKQRFKPSRKPKPIPNEEGSAERQPNAAPAHNDNTDLREPPPVRGEALSDEPDTESPSR